jgi:lysozyme family protein
MNTTETTTAATNDPDWDAYSAAYEAEWSRLHATPERRAEVEARVAEFLHPKDECESVAKQVFYCACREAVLRHITPY